MEQEKRECRAVVDVLVAATAWGCLGLFTRYLAGFGMSPLAVAFFRSFSAAVMLACYLGLRSRETFCIRLRDVWMFVGTGFISIGLFNVFYFATQNFTTLSIAAVLLYTAPFFVIIMSKLFFKEHITKQKVIALLLAFVGCLFVTGVVGSGGGTLAPIAIATGLASAFCYALYSIFGRVALSHYAPMTVTFYSLFVSALSLGIISGVTGAEMPAVKWQMVAGICGLGFVSTVIPYIFYTRGLQVLAPSKASVLAFAKPMVATIVGILVMHEPLTIPAVIGIGLIFSGIVILNRRSQK